MQIRRLMQTTIPLPSIASVRFSKCSTMIAGDERDALLGADDRFELRPLRLQLLAADGLLAFGHFLEAGVDLRPLGLVESQLGKAALVVDRHGRLVVDRPLNVVDADVVAEHGAGAGVGQLDGRSR